MRMDNAARVKTRSRPENEKISCKVSLAGEKPCVASFIRHLSAEVHEEQVCHTDGCQKVEHLRKK